MTAHRPSLLVAPFVCTLLTMGAVRTAAAAIQVDTSQEAQVPTAIERALIDRACRATELSTQIDAHRQCVDAQLLFLRTDFGRDLSRLPAVDRRRIDAACSRLSAEGQREAYLDCLSGQLVALHNRRNRGAPATDDAAATAAAAAAAPAAPAAPPPPTRSWTSAVVIAGTVGTALCAAGFVVLSRRPRRTMRPCRTCGVSVPDSDLCAACRHEAAEALRHANAERAQQQKAHEEEERRQREYEAEQIELRAHEAEETRLREQELEREAQAAQEAARDIEPTVVPTPPAVEALKPAREEADVFDPYAVLHLSRDAGPDAILAAYQLAKTKYDPDMVSYLGDEAQAHFKAKAEAVELAYQMLSAAK